MGLISFESYIKVFIYLLCGNGDLLRQIDAEKRGLGHILNNLAVPSPDGKSGLFDARYAGLFDTLRRYRNGITHAPSDTNVYESDILVVRKNPNDAYDELFLLTLTGLLLLLHHHADYYRRYLDEHLPELPPKKAAAESPADDFDLERFKDHYLEELLGEQNRELKQKVGFIGRIDNQQTLNLLPLKLQRRQDAGEEPSDPDYGDRPHEGGDFTDGEQGGMAMDDLMDAGDRISLILGNPGAGKTTVLIRLIRQYADLWHNGDRSILPLRINLNAVTEGQTMDDALRTAFNAGFGITTTEDRKRMVFAHAEQLLAEGRIALFIDGLNELKVSRPELFIASLGSFIAKYDKCRFHITGRIHEFAACREAFRRIEGCGVYHLCEISLDQILLYLRQLGLPEERIDEFRLQIIRAGIEELLGTPLNFMMIAALLLGSTEYKIPAVGNRGELLEMFMRSSLSLRSREKLVDEAVNFNAFDLLQRMAWRIAAEGQRVLREDFVIEIARDPRYKGADRVEKLVDSLIGLHIVEQNVDHQGSWLTFFVDTYLEYFFARRLGVRLLRAARAAARATGRKQRAQFRNPETHAGADLQRMGPQGGAHRRRPRLRQGPLRPGAQSRAAGADDHRRRRAANRRVARQTGRQRKPGPRGAHGFRPETLYRQNESQRAAADRIVAAQYDGRLPDRPSGFPTRKEITTISGSWPNAPSSCRASGFSGNFFRTTG